jgi:hypothetical protein
MNGSESLRDECWVVTEGHAGMENQALGLAQRLPLPIRVFRVALRRPWTWLAPNSVGSVFRQAKRGSDRIEPPWPRLLIGCGRQSIPFSRAVKRASGGRTMTVQCQDPRVDPACFDLVIPPEHDELTGPNVFPIVGSPNRVTAERLAQSRLEFAPLFESLREPRVAVLIGGRSRRNGNFDHDAAARLAPMLSRLAQGYGLMVTTSRRTPADATAILRRATAGSGAFFWDGSGANPYLGLLAWADAFIVTADSVNMICEAAATGKPVHVFPLAGGRRKAQLFQRSLTERGIARPFNGAIQQWRYAPLDETGRAVDRIAALLETD